MARVDGAGTSHVHPNSAQGSSAHVTLPLIGGVTEMAFLRWFPLFAAMAGLAERGGFEPPLGYYPKHAFQACDLNHSSTSPRVESLAQMVAALRFGSGRYA